MTDHKRDGRMLEETAQRLKSVIEASPNAIVVSDNGGIVEQWNPAAERIFGWSAEEVIGEQVPIVPDGKAAEFQAHRQRMRRGAPIEGIETRRLTKEGEKIDVRLSAAPVIDSDGEISGAMAIFEDITARKERQRDLEQKETLLNHSEDAIFVSDPRTAEIQYVNDTACRRLGYERAELLDLTILDIQTELPDLEAWHDHIERVRAEGSVFFEGEHVRRDGTTFPVEVNVSLEAVQGAEYQVGAARDITHRKEYERELQRQIERLDRFTSVVSHDLRNPLNVAMGRLETVRSECDDQRLDEIANAHDRMLALIEQLLALAKTGAAVGELESVRLHDVVRSCWQNVDTADATLVTGGEAAVRADGNRLQQLLENAFRNAIEHGGDEVTVTVGLLARGFYIEDDGPGIPAGARERVFEEGFSTARDGTGFGLSIVNEVAEAHGWDVAVTEGSAGGARLEFTGVTVESV